MDDHRSVIRFLYDLRISVEILVSNIIIFHEFINYTKRAANPITKPISHNVKLQISDHALMMILFFCSSQGKH